MSFSRLLVVMWLSGKNRSLCDFLGVAEKVEVFVMLWKDCKNGEKNEKKKDCSRLELKK